MPTATTASATGVRTPEPTPIVIAPTISAANKPKLGPLFPAGTTFIRAEAYFSIEIDGTAQSAFFFEVAPRTAVLAPVDGQVATGPGLVVITATVTGVNIVITHIETFVETGATVQVGDQVGWTTEADQDVPSGLSMRATPSVSMPVNLILGITPPGLAGTYGQVDVTLDPDSWWE
jgi:hypothetical protein